MICCRQSSWKKASRTNTERRQDGIVSGLHAYYYYFVKRSRLLGPIRCSLAPCCQEFSLVKSQQAKMGDQMAQRNVTDIFSSPRNASERRPGQSRVKRQALCSGER